MARREARASGASEAHGRPPCGQGAGSLPRSSASAIVRERRTAGGGSAPGRPGDLAVYRGVGTPEQREERSGAGAVPAHVLRDETAGLIGMLTAI